MTAAVQSMAVLSDCGGYRYMLGRRWGDPATQALVWVMLNPSTADASVDDPTIRRVVRFTRDAGFPAAIVLNLYGLRATDPAELRGHPDPVGPGNDAALEHLTQDHNVVVAWGAFADTQRDGRVAEVLNGPLKDRHLLCLGTTKHGHPRHPLYVPAAQQLVEYPR